MRDLKNSVEINEEYTILLLLPVIKIPMKTAIHSISGIPGIGFKHRLSVYSISTVFLFVIGLFCHDMYYQ